VTRRRGPVVLNAPPRVRERTRADGSVRVWWEPRPAEAALGFKPVELDAARPDWCRAEAARLNAALEKARRLGGTARVRGGRTMLDLIVDYRQSVHWAEGLRPATRASYDKLLSVIEDKWAHQRAVSFDKPTMAAWYQTLYRSRGPRMAQALIRMMSILFGHAEVLGWRPEGSNPCQALRLRTPAERDRIASWDEIDAILAAAAAAGLPGIALAVRIGLYTGQRQTDILAAPRGAFAIHVLRLPGDRAPRGRWIWTFRRSKRGNAGALALHDDLVPHVRAALAEARPDAAPLIVDPGNGRAYDAVRFNKHWRKVLALAAATVPTVTTLQFRDLRRTFGAMARLGGASRDDVGHALGNSAATDPRLDRTYMPPLVETASRAASAIKRPKAVGKRGQG
jgi:integrase